MCSLTLRFLLFGNFRYEIVTTPWYFSKWFRFPKFFCHDKFSIARHGFHGFAAEKPHARWDLAVDMSVHTIEADYPSFG